MNVVEIKTTYWGRRELVRLVRKTKLKCWAAPTSQNYFWSLSGNVVCCISPCREWEGEESVSLCNILSRSPCCSHTIFSLGPAGCRPPPATGCQSGHPCTDYDDQIFPYDNQIYPKDLAMVQKMFIKALVHSTNTNLVDWLIVWDIILRN